MSLRYASFEGFVFDRRCGTLEHGTARVALLPKSAEILSLLLDRAGTVVAKEELIEGLWPGDYVQESNLSQQVYLLRKALAPYGADGLVQTVPRRGYRFSAVVAEHESLTHEVSPAPERTRSPLVPMADSGVTSRRRLPLALAFALLVFALAFSRDQSLHSSASAALDPAAARAYVLGRYYFGKRDEPNLQRGVREFEEVVRRDPTSPLGHSGLADSFGQLFLLAKPEQMRAYAKRGLAEATVALADGPDSAEAHASYGYELAMTRKAGSLDQAVVELKRAVALDPSYVNAHLWLGIFSLNTGDLEFGRSELRAATALDPTSVPSARWLGFADYYSHRYDAAIVELRHALELDPRNDDAALHLALALEQRGRVADAETVLKPLRREYGRAPFEAWMAYAHALAGRRGLAGREIAEVLASRDRADVGGVSIAAVYAALGREDEARFWLRLWKHAGDSSSIYPKYDPRLASLNVTLATGYGG